MRKKKETEQPKQNTPTPNLGTPRANRQLFTFSENKLLDQITLEIVEAWATDLMVIKDCHKETLKAVKEFQSVNKLLQDKFLKLNQFVNEDWFLKDMKTIIDNQSIIFSFMNDIRKECFETQKQALGLRDEMQIFTRMFLSSQKANPIRKWWQFWRRA